MAGFARWLREAKNLSQTDKAAAACATPPHLEGALLSRLSKNKLCEDDNIDHPKVDIPKQINELNYDYNSIISHTSSESKISSIKSEVFENIDQDINYVEDSKPEVDGLEDDLYDGELDLQSVDDLPITNSKVISNICTLFKIKFKGLLYF